MFKTLSKPAKPGAPMKWQPNSKHSPLLHKFYLGRDVAGNHSQSIGSDCHSDLRQPVVSKGSEHSFQLEHPSTVPQPSEVLNLKRKYVPITEYSSTPLVAKDDLDFNRSPPSKKVLGDFDITKRVPSFDATSIECLGNLGQYQMAAATSDSPTSLNSTSITTSGLDGPDANDNRSFVNVTGFSRSPLTPHVGTEMTRGYNNNSQNNSKWYLNQYPTGSAPFSGLISPTDITSTHDKQDQSILSKLYDATHPGTTSSSTIKELMTYHRQPVSNHDQSPKYPTYTEADSVLNLVTTEYLDLSDLLTENLLDLVQASISESHQRLCQLCTSMRIASFVEEIPQPGLLTEIGLLALRNVFIGRPPSTLWEVYALVYLACACATLINPGELSDPDNVLDDVRNWNTIVDDTERLVFDTIVQQFWKPETCHFGTQHNPASTEDYPQSSIGHQWVVDPFPFANSRLMSQRKAKFNATSFTEEPTTPSPVGPKETANFLTMLKGGCTIQLCTQYLDIMRVCGDFPDLIQSQKSNDTTLHRFPMCDSHYARYIDSILKLLYTRQRQSFRQNAPPINPSQPSYHFEQPVDQVNEAESPTLTESTVANSDTSSHRSSITTISPTSNYSVDLAIHPKVSLAAEAFTKDRRLSSLQTPQQQLKTSRSDSLVSSISSPYSNVISPTSSIGTRSSISASDDPHQCPLCPQTFKGKPRDARRNRKRHIENKHCESPMQWVCPLCATTITGRKDNYKAHLKKKHGKETVEAEEDGELMESGLEGRGAEEARLLLGPTV